MESFRRFEDIEVKLVSAVPSAYELSVASARTCYSGKGAVYPEQVSVDEKAIALRDKIASSTLEAGHLTTRQHAHFVFVISGVSRHCLWNFLHSHPFYNSEQVSQRYVRVKPGNVVMPPLEGEAAKVYAEVTAMQTQSYETLIQLLQAPLSADFYQRFPARKKTPEKWATGINKRAYEVARYTLGVGTTAYLYHTISALTLLRYAKLMDHFETPEEQRVLVQKMLDCVLAVDPLFAKEIQDPLPLEASPEYQFRQAGLARTVSAEFAKEFDESLEGHVSKLIQHSSDPETVLAQAVRIQLGKLKSQMPDDVALSLLLDPKENKFIADTLNVGTFERMSQVLHHASFTYQKKLSHTADSQDQRHRMVFSSRPSMFFHYSGEPDYITPFGITQNDEAHDLYRRCMDESFKGVNRLIDAGVKPDLAFYLLPNAVAIRMVSSGDLQSWQHKWKLRTCYNAQEEIFQASLDEIKQLRDKFPKLAQHMKAPCYLRLRAGVKPYCPEGDRFCGLPVWKYDINDYARKSL